MGELRPHVRFVVDGEDRIRYISAYGAALLGYVESELLGMDAMALLAPGKDETHRARVHAEVQKHPDEPCSFHGTLLHRDGHVIDVSTTLTWLSTQQQLLVDADVPDEEIARMRKLGPQFQDPFEHARFQEFLEQQAQQRVGELEKLIEVARQQVAYYQRAVEVLPVDTGHLSNVSALVLPGQLTLPGMNGEDNAKLDRVLAELAANSRQLEELKHKLSSNGEVKEKKPRARVDPVEKKHDYIVRTNEAYARFQDLPPSKRRSKDLRPYLAEQWAYTWHHVAKLARDYGLKVEDLPWPED